MMIHLLLIFPAFGQSRISGQVIDPQGHPVIGANVYLINTYDGTSTDLKGHFRFTSNELGTQTLLVTYLGFTDYRKTIQLTGDPLTFTISLRENAFELESVVITAGAFEASNEGRQEVLQPLDIVTTAGATADIAGALNTLSGTTTVGESGRLFVRGSEGYETQTFIDGLQVMNFYSPSAPNTPGRSRFLPFMFSGTSFSTGGYSAEYGQALSSALILQSKFLATQKRTDFSLMSVGGDAATTQVWNKASLSVKGQYTNLDPYLGLIDQDINWVKAPTSWEGSAAYRKKISATGILKVFGNFNRSAFTLDRSQILDHLVAIFVESDLYFSRSLLARVGLRSEYSALSKDLHLAPRISLALKTSEKGQVSAAFGHFRQTAQNEWLMITPKLEHILLDILRNSAATGR